MAAKSKSRAQSRREKYSPDGNELLVMELQQINSAESQLSRVLPRLASAAESEDLRQMIERRREEGERILQELESAFDELEESPGRQRNFAAEGLINDVREHTQEVEEGPALDAVLIAGLQKTEHYCIAAWGTAKSLAQATGQKSATRAMERALKEGRSYDEQLTQLAENKITPALLSEEEDDSEDTPEGDDDQTGRRRSRPKERRAST
jgi:ferritin-like metal-binding protein YciE